jgi:hypothetical protein
MRRTMIAPPTTTGRSTARLMPMMETSGALMIGVLAMPPSLPRLVSVRVEPVSSSRVALLVRAASVTRRISVATSHSDRSCTSRTTGTFSPSDVCVATPRCTAR